MGTVDFFRSRRNTKWTRYGPDVIPAWVADMDFGVAPAVQAAIKRLVDEQDYGYADREGGFPERAVAFAFSRHQKELYGWEPDPDLVVPLPDLVQAMLATIVAFTEPSEGVVLQLPAYPPFISTIEASGRKLIANPMIDDGNGWCLDLARLEADAPSARLLMVCNPQNPTGRVLTRVELSALGRVAIDHDLVIVCDEVHAELTYAGSAHLPMALVSPEIAARTVTITSATKSFNIAGLRCAVMHFGSPKLFDRFRKRIPDGLLGHLSVVGVDATIAAWADGAQWLQSTLGHLDANRGHLGDFVAQRKYIGYHEPQATYLAWLDLTNLNLEPSPWEFLKRTANIVTTAGWEFGQDYGQFVRLNFATPSAVLEEILSRIAAAIG
jgi:cystathionine beta-lyase